MSELTAYKTFFSSKSDTLERDSSSSYQMLLSLKHENDILNHKLHKLKIQNEYLKSCISQNSLMSMKMYVIKMLII
jgi:hypothetical protein